MAKRSHRYRIALRWTGNRGGGTASYSAYDRSFSCAAAGKATIDGSADPAFRGDPTRWNPEELLVASLASCHQLWYLHLCADAGIVVVAYEDLPIGSMDEEADGTGRMASIMLNPTVVVAPDSDLARATALHAEASRMCFIEQTLNCTVECHPSVRVSYGGGADPSFRT